MATNLPRANPAMPLPPVPLQWTAAMPLTKGVRSMSSTQEIASNVVTASALAASNGAAWFSSEQVGMVVTGATVLGTLVIGLVSKAIKEVGKARAEAWADRMRVESQARIDTEKIEAQARLEREKIEAGSLNGQIKALLAKVEEGNARSAELQRRIEDANKKLHDAANERQNEVYRHHEEVEMLMKQIELMTKQLDESREENRVLMTKLEAKVNANTGAIDRIVSPDTGTGEMGTTNG